MISIRGLVTRAKRPNRTALGLGVSMQQERRAERAIKDAEW